ncbi:MAG: hydantoinase/oxoprolinase family protein [Shinella sp.]|uniref:hydantoinase/oxoprolinase family protein n=1 Tax=Shinella sp. TaxID=1870904 RepID=UPI003C751E62
MDRQLRIAVDIGGTFTDGIIEDTRTGGIWVGKCLTTPHDPGEGVSTVIAQMLSHIDRNAEGSSSEDVVGVVHATTLVTNTLIERRGAHTALVLTDGTKDLPNIARELRYDLYDLDLELPEPLVPFEQRYELAERISHEGEIVQPVEDKGMADLAQAIASKGDVEAVAICFLNAYANPAHELAMEQALQKAIPGISVSISSRTAAEPGEYERMSTVTANAYVQPLMTRYLGMLAERLEKANIDATLRIMLSNGGFTSVEAAARSPIQLLESGPAAGVLSAINAGEAAGESSILAFDMGGTTAKACVVHNGEALIKYGFETARVRRFRKGSGLPILIPSIDLIEIGAGGGSIASINRVGTISVGPESASSVPGPVCYGLGGDQPTVTDADLLLGYLNPNRFLGGEMTLKPELAEQAFARLGADMGKSGKEMAWGVCSVVNEAMAAAARVHIAEHGHDPRSFTMVATGGAGPVHVVDVARRLGISRILSPIAAGAGSCLGLLAAAARTDRTWAHKSLLDSTDWDVVRQSLAALREDALAELTSTGAAQDKVEWTVGINTRYFGQGHEIEIHIPYAQLGDGCAARIEAEFGERYRHVYGMAVPNAVIEIVTWRLIGRVPREKRSFVWGETRGHQGANVGEEREIYLPLTGRYEKVPVLDRYSLAAGAVVEGPLVLEERESTIVVPFPAKVTILSNLTVQIDLAPRAEK